MENNKLEFLKGFSKITNIPVGEAACKWFDYYHRMGFADDIAKIFEEKGFLEGKKHGNFYILNLHQ